MKYEGDEENTSDAGQTDVTAKKAATSADAPAPRKPKKRSKTVAKKAAKAKKAPAKKRAKAASNGKAPAGMRSMTGEGLVGEMRLNEGPRAEMAKHLEKNKGKMVTLAALAKAFDGDETAARQAVIRFRGKIAKYKLPYDLKTDEETAGRYGLFGRR